jgi:hypothetical protein
MTRHTGTDGVSGHPPAENDHPKNDDFEDRLDTAYSFSISLLNNQLPPTWWDY